MFWILILIILSIIVFNYVMHNTRNRKLINKLPGPNGIPVFGYLLQLLVTPVKLFYLERMLGSRFRKYGLCRFWILYSPTVNIYNPEDLEILLSSSKYISKGQSYNLLHPWLNTGLLTSDGEKWQKRRKILTPAFHFNILKQFCNIFIEQGNNLIGDLNKELEKSETEILPYITNFALHSICETAMGTNLDSGQSNVKRYKKAIYEMGELIIYRAARIWLHINSLYNFSETGKKQNELLSDLHKFTKNVIRERRQEEIKFDENDSSETNDVGIKKRLAMLDLLLKCENEGLIDEEGIREEVDTFMFEGHDTTTVAIMFFWMLLANHPDIQERIVNEINEITNNRQINVEDLGKMNYMEMCIKESLRLYPSVSFISRHLKEDIQLRDYLIPANTEIDINIIDIHKNPKIYPNPDKYDPDRFLPEVARNRHPYSFIAFSAGPRNCIGQRFALLEIKAITAIVLQTYKMEAVTKPQDLTLIADLVLRTATKIKVKFSKR